MRCHVIQNDEELPILLYNCEISNTSLAKWLVSKCLQVYGESGGVKGNSDRSKSKDSQESEDIDSLLNEVRTRFNRFFVDGTTIFSHQHRTNWNCLRLIKRAEILSSFNLAQLESHVITDELPRGAEIKLPDFFADILKDKFLHALGFKTIAGSIKYHLTLAYLIGDKYPPDVKFVFSSAVRASDAKTLNEILSTFIHSPDYLLNVPKPPGYDDKEPISRFPLVYGMSTWPDSTIPSFDDIRLRDWGTIQWPNQKVQCKQRSLLEKFKIEYKAYGDICVFYLRDFCLKAEPVYVKSILPRSGIPYLSDRPLREALALTNRVEPMFSLKIAAAVQLLENKSFLVSPAQIKNLDVEKMRDPLFAVELQYKNNVSYCSLSEYLATLSPEKVRETLPTSWAVSPLRDPFTAKEGPNTLAYDLKTQRIIKLGDLLTEMIKDTGSLLSCFFRDRDPNQLLLDLSDLGMVRGISKLRDLKNYTLTSNEFLSGSPLPAANYNEILIDGVPLLEFLFNLKWNSAEVKAIAYQVLAGKRPGDLLNYLAGITIIESERLPFLSDQEIKSLRLLIHEDRTLYFDFEYDDLLVSQNRVRTALLKRRQRIFGF